MFTVPPMDYEQLTQLLMFSSCDIRNCIYVKIENDDIVEGSESFSVNLMRTTDPRIALQPTSAIVNILGNVYIYMCIHFTSFSVLRWPTVHLLRYPLPAPVPVPAAVVHGTWCIEQVIVTGAAAGAVRCIEHVIIRCATASTVAGAGTRYHGR